MINLPKFSIIREIIAVFNVYISNILLLSLSHIYIPYTEKIMLFVKKVGVFVLKASESKKP